MTLFNKCFDEVKLHKIDSLVQLNTHISSKLFRAPAILVDKFLDAFLD